MFVFLEKDYFLSMLLVLLVGVFGLLLKALLDNIIMFCPYSEPVVIFLLLLSFDNELLGLTDLFIEVYKVLVFLLIVKLSSGLTASLNSLGFILASPSISILLMIAIINLSSGII